MSKGKWYWKGNGVFTIDELVEKFKKYHITKSIKEFNKNIKKEKINER